jgi:hypothetical protein
MGTESGRLVQTGSDLGAAITNFLKIIAAFDRAVRFAHDPLEILARFLTAKILPKQRRPQIQPKKNLPKIS